MYHYFYKITNKITHQFYYGIHSTKNMNDGYMGSGSYIRRMYRQQGKANFIKEILRFFDNREDLLKYEEQIVNNELLQDPLCMNLVKGGFGSVNSYNLVTVRDKEGNVFDVRQDDPRYVSGEYVSINKGFVVVRGCDGSYMRVSVNDPRYISGELEIVSKRNKGGLGKRWMKKDNDYIFTDDFARKEKEGWVYESPMIGRNGTTTDMIHIKRGNESKMIRKGQISKYLNDGWIIGRNTKPNANKICIHKDGSNKYISPSHLNEYLANGWQTGGTSRNIGKLTCTLDGGQTWVQLNKNDERVLSGIAKTSAELNPTCSGLIYIHKENTEKRIKIDDIEIFLNDGWIRGRKKP